MSKLIIVVLELNSIFRAGLTALVASDTLVAIVVGHEAIVVEVEDILRADGNTFSAVRTLIPVDRREHNASC
jgi:hypothetical protein